MIWLRTGKELMNLQVIFNAGNFLSIMETVSFQEGLCSMEFFPWLVSEWCVLKNEQRVTNTKAKEIKFLWKQLNITWGLDKFRDKVGYWREQIQRVEEDILEVAESYTVQEDEPQGRKESWEGAGVGRWDCGVKRNNNNNNNNKTNNHVTTSGLQT